VAWHGKISILDTAITSWDASIGGPDERLEGRAFIAALSSETADGTHTYTSRMDVEDSEISYLGNEGDYHNDIGECAATCFSPARNIIGLVRARVTCWKC